MKKVLKRIVVVIIILAGIAMLLYPFMGNIIGYFYQQKVYADYENSVDKLNKTQIEKQHKDAEKYNNSLGSNAVTDDPFSDNKTDNDSNFDYYNTLNIADNVMAFIKIPKINVDLPIYHGISEKVLMQAVGHISTSSLPIGGNTTHCVITGHTGLPNAEIFSDISKLSEKDLFYIYVLNEIHVYKVDMIKVIEPSNLSELSIVRNKDYVTLVTCTPYGINSHRLLVRGERDLITEKSLNNDTDKTDLPVSIDKDNKTVSKNTNIITRVMNSRFYQYCIIVSIILIIFILTFIILNKRKNKKKNADKQNQTSKINNDSEKTNEKET